MADPEEPVFVPPVRTKPISKPSGRNVTANFPKAVEQDFLVYRLSHGQYNIFDKDDTAQPINVRPLSREDVNAEIQKVLAGGK
jgi:hypothetical protein